MEDTEVRAIQQVTTALEPLNDEQRQNVLLYVNARYRTRNPSGPQRSATFQATSANCPQYESIGELFDAANPQTEAERVLVVAYWIQVFEGIQEFEAYLVSKHLKNLGHPVSNITRALDSMIKASPRFILQTRKSGKSKQARKAYKVTREGIRRVEAMSKNSVSGDLVDDN